VHRAETAPGRLPAPVGPAVQRGLRNNLAAGRRAVRQAADWLLPRGVARRPRREAAALRGCGLLPNSLAVAIAVALLSSPSQAASTLTFKAIAISGKGSPSARIYAGPVSVMTLSGHGWKSIEQAREIAQRLNGLAEEGLQPDEIGIWSERRTRTVMARGERIVTIDKATAASRGTDRLSLARVWAENLRTEFGRPYLSAAPVLVPVGETRAVAVRGNIAGQLVVRAEGEAVSAAWDEGRKEVVVRGLQPGRAELVLEDSENALGVPVRAARYAAQLVRSLTAGVTGSPASPEMIARAVRATMQASIGVEPGAWANVNPWVKDTPSLWPGHSASVPVEVSAGGPDYLPFHARPVVGVRNEVLSEIPPSVLMVSNSPERLLNYGLWFEGKMGDWQSVRLLYHHVNGAANSSDLVVELWNLGQQMAQVQVVAGTGGPSDDESWVGHRAAGEFLANREGGIGWVVPAPAGMATPVIVQRLRKGSVASGVLELRAVGPADLSLRLYLAPASSERMPRSMDAYTESPLLGHGHYPQPSRHVSARYEVGREWAFVTIGDQPAAGVLGGDLLAGSYGVLYEIDLELANPSAVPAQVAVLLEPAGGPARGALLVDGRSVETALLSRNSEGLIARYTLAAGQTRRVHIETMPQGGSNYPVRLVARPI